MAESVANKRGPVRGEEYRKKKRTKKIWRFSIKRKKSKTAFSRTKRKNKCDCITSQSTNNLPVYYIIFCK